MRRRFVIAVLVGIALAPPLSAGAAEPARVFHVGMINLNLPRSAPFNAAFEQRLRELGYVEGETLAVDFRELDAAAKAHGVALVPVSVADVNELPAGFAEMTTHHCRALVVMSDPLFVFASRQLIELAGQHRIAASYDNRLIVDAGGLMSYGPDTVDMFRQSARYVDKILKGEKPADLPIEQPTKFVLAINLKAAEAIGLTIPPSILALADELIE
jgi:ABC-type uncharacterized transport system substrate-binding protein